MPHKINKKTVRHPLKKNKIPKIPLNQKMSESIQRIWKKFHRSPDTNILQFRVENVGQN